MRQPTREEMRAYRPYGSALQVLYAKDDEVLLSGPAGTGKSRGVLEKFHLCAEKYPGMRGLFLRKTRASLTHSGLVTFETKVVPAGHPILEGAARPQRGSYVYPNGSEIVVGGLDKPGKIMSTEYDLVYIQEAIEVTENDLESVTTRLRNGVMPYQQLIADTNPDKPTHWLLQRCLRGQTRMIECRHEDNPVYWDHEKGEYTPAGRAYIQGKLDKLTGVRLQRLRYGKWVAAEGLIFDEFDAAVHMVDEKDLPKGWQKWPRLWVVDFGFKNPFVWQEWAIDPDGRLWRIQEIYKSKTLVEDHARRILQLTKGSPEPIAIVCDHDAEDRATLERHLGMKTKAAHKTVSDGIQAVKSRLRPEDDGKPRIYFVRDAIDERDADLEERKLPCCTEEEFDGYVWDTSGGRRKGEEPVKENDHGSDATRYAVAERDLVKKRRLVAA
jgi:phage terminase large subunit